MAMAVLFAAAPSANAAVACPNPNPVVDENQCQTGTTGWQVNDYSPDIGGFPTQQSTNLGSDVTLKIARNAPAFPAVTANIAVYRMGYYGGVGARLVNSKTGVTINNDFTCNPMDTTTGKVDCGSWQPTYTIPGSAFPASGIYLAKITASTGEQSHIVFTIRDDARQPQSKLLYVLPTADYQAYNTFGGKSVYFSTAGGNTVSGTGRAVKVSFNRPLSTVGREKDWLFGPDYNTLYWLEQQGYDVSYTEDVDVHRNPAKLLQHDAVVVPGHSEYWSLEEYNAFKNARDAGVNLASFSANTTYWKVRYEENEQTLVCYKTVEGGGSSGSGSISANDWGPDGQQGTADDALGLDGKAGTADDNPQNATTTWRDNGAPPGDPNAPAGGRVGPNLPENSLWGVMYVGDNDAVRFPLTVPPANANDEFAADRVWRNTGIATNGSTDLGTEIVGWEWDAVPTQAQYLAFQPAGVKRVSATNVQAQSDNSWLQDEGRARATTPPPGQPGTVNAVKYTAPSGALVFAGGTNRWGLGLSDDADPRFQQATYNILSDMGIQPDTPVGVTLDPGGTNKAPTASFTISANPTKTKTTVKFDGSASADPNGTIAKYEWDLNGDGTFETNTATNPVASTTYAAEGDYTVRLRVTDNGGATDLQVKTLTILDNQPPVAAFTVSPNPAVVGQTVTVNGSTSSDPDGTVATYEWDFDGNGTYEVNSGASASTTTSFATPGTVTVGLRVTDNGGKQATKSLPVTVNNGGISNYGDAILDTPGLVSFWRLGETSGSVFADSKGTSPAAAFGEPQLGVQGGPPSDPNSAVRFDGVNDNAQAKLNLSGTNKVTVEFWASWTFGNDDRLAMEFTPSYHDNDGGFLIDPNAPQLGGKFAVGIGRGTSRNTVFFDRPTTGTWHHYAFVLDSSAAAETQITPYIDGQAAAYTKMNTGTGAGNFANSTLYLMSRSGTALFGQGDLDEVAIYNRALSAAEVAEHAASYGTNRRPVGSFTATPNPVAPNTQVKFDASGSKDPDGSIVKYEWDLDGNGSFETNTGTTPTATKAYAAEGDVSVRLRVTDDLTGTDVETKTVKVITNQTPVASFTANPNPAVLGQTTAFDASASKDPDGSIAKYEWDLDGDGTYETDTGTNATATRQYTTTGSRNVSLRVSDAKGLVASSAMSVAVFENGVSSYGDTVQDTPGLVSYLRMGETSGTTFANAKAGGSPATVAGGVTMGVPGAVLGDPNLSARFDGVDDAASTQLDLSGTSKATVEFWLKWNAYANNDKLAMEFTDNFNDNAGGFIVDPNAPQVGTGSFGVGIGNNTARNNAFFTRPSAGDWHHYAIVLDSTAPAAEQVIPYVDGKAVSYTKVGTSAGAGAFANAKLNLMSRAGSSLFGAGDLDELAVYNRALDAGTIAEHFASYGTNRRPVAKLSAAPNPAQTSQTVTFSAAGSTDTDGSITKYEWDLDGNGSFETSTGTTSTAGTKYAADGTYAAKVRVYDDQNGTDTETTTITVGNNAPTASFTATPNPVVVNGTVTFDASASTDDGTIVKYEWDLDGDGSFETQTGTKATTSRSYPAAATIDAKLRVTDDLGLSTTVNKPVSVLAAGQPPTATFTVAPDPAAVAGTVTFNASGSNDADGPIAKYEWDLDGNGSYETDTGSTPTATRAYAEAGTVTVALRVTDGSSATATTTRDAHINGKGNDYAGKVLATGGLMHYWRMGDAAGTTLADAKGASPATIADGPSLGAPGSVPGTDTAVSFDGVNDGASAPVNLSGTNKATLEFWLKWDAYANDDRLAFEFTPNFNTSAGGILVDPNAPLNGGRFGIGIGSGVSRNTAYFARPSAGQWHHYAIVLDTSAPAATQITPYVDGVAVPYTKANSGTGAGNFANSKLNFMSRNVAALFGGGDLDEVAVYGRTLTAAEVADHYNSAANVAPAASFTASPTPAQTGQTISLDATGSADPDGTLVKYEWDLDGNGSYEIDGGGTATRTVTFATTGAKTIGLRVTDNKGATATTTRSLTVQAPQTPPTASFTAAPDTVATGGSVSFDASSSSDLDGPIAKYEWDLDGNGSYETDTGTVATASRTYQSPGTVTVKLRVTDAGGATGEASRAVTITNRAPTAALSATPNPATTRQAVTFNGSTSSDPDGTIAKYEWDLDGNGTYELDSGATATASKTYDTVGTPNVGLRVTDSNGATGTASKSLTVNSAYATSVLGTAGIKGYWRLADTAATAADASTSANPGTLTNGPVSIGGLLTGEVNAAIDFDGINDFVNLSPTPFGTPSTFSAEAWVRTGSTKSAGNYHYLISDSSSDFNNGFTLAVDSSNRATFVVARTQILTTRGQATSSVTLAPNTTHHVVGTYDGSRVRVFVDGVERGNVAFSGGATWASGRDINLGRKVASASQASSYLDGTLDEAALYTTALPAATVSAHYNAGKP